MHHQPSESSGPWPRLGGVLPMPFGTAGSAVWYLCIALYVGLYGISLEPRYDDGRASAAIGGGAHVPEARLATAPYPAWVHTHWVRIDRDHQTTESVLALVDSYLRRDITVGAVTLDAGWAERGTLRLNRTRFPDVVGFGGDDGGAGVGASSALMGGLPGRHANDNAAATSSSKRTIVQALQHRGVRVLLYVVPLLEEGTAVFADAQAKGFCLRPARKDATATPAGVVRWDGGNAPDGPGAVSGCLVDFTSAAAAAWYHATMTDEAIALGADGFKNDAVDVLFSQLGGASPTAIGADGRPVTQQAWARAYYWAFFDHGRNGGKRFDHVTSFRPVDTVMGATFHAFGPPDISFACFVGNHPPSFAGLREALMNAIQSSYRGYLNFGTSVGGTGSAAADTPATTTSSSGVRVAMQRRELFVRWTQIAAFTPFLENGGLQRLHAPWAVGCVDNSAAINCAPRDVGSLPPHGIAEAVYRHTVALHRALIPYFVSTATAAYIRDESFARWAQHHPAAAGGTKPRSRRNAADADPHGPDAAHPPFYPLARKVAFEEPREGFAFLLGRDVFVAPVVAGSVDDATVIPGHLAADSESPPPPSLIAVDEELASIVRTNVTFATPPWDDAWVDPANNFATVYAGNGRQYTAVRNLTQGPLALLRAGAIVPVGPEATSVGWELRGDSWSRFHHGIPGYFGAPLFGIDTDLHDHRTAATSGHHDPKKKNEAAHNEAEEASKHFFTTDHAVVPILIVSPMKNTRRGDWAHIHREHDGGLTVSTAISEDDLPGSTAAAHGARMLTVEYTAFHHPVVISIRGVRCVMCRAPEGFDLVTQAEFAAAVAGGTGHEAVLGGAGEQARNLAVQRRLACVLLQEPTSTVLLFDPAPLTGNSVTLGPFA